MVEALGGVTAQLALMALDAYALRHQAIASNIANHASAGYQPLAVDFEVHLDGLREAVHAQRGDAEVAALLDDARAQIAVVPSGESEVKLDEEMGALARNTLQYQALLTALGRLGSLSRIAIRGDGR